MQKFNLSENIISKIEFKILNSVPDRDLIVKLYQDAGWWDDSYEKSFIDKIVSDSFLFAGAFNEQNKLIGMARALADGISDAYIQDVTVLKNYRNQGIGGNLIKFLVKELKKHEIDWIGLIGEPGTEKFYQRLGFEKMNNYIPMKLK